MSVYTEFKSSLGSITYALKKKKNSEKKSLTIETDIKYRSETRFYTHI